MRRRMLLGAVAGLVLIVGGTMLLQPESPRPSPITRKNYHRIHFGMTRVEVEAILGPPGDYRSGRAEVWENLNGERVKLPECDEGDTPWRGTEAQWYCDTCYIDVCFDATGRVEEIGTTPIRRERLVENLVWRAKRQWRKFFPERAEQTGYERPGPVIY